jgi:membrane protein YdbS with pleckstrin-like domain
MQDKNIIYQARLSWVLFVWPLLMLCVAAYLGIRYSALHQPSLILAAVGIIWFLVTWVTYQFSSITIKKKQIMLRTGFLVRKTVDIPLNKIESVDIRQSILGSILQYGSLVITGTGGTRQLINFLDKPLTCRRYVEQLMHE